VVKLTLKEGIPKLKEILEKKPRVIMTLGGAREIVLLRNFFGL